MRILIISRGPLGYLTDARKLCEYAARMHEVTFLSFDALGFMLKAQSWPDLAGVRKRTVPRTGGRPIRFVRWLWRCVREMGSGFDLVYVYYFPGCAFLRLAHPGLPVVLDIRSGSTSPQCPLRLLQDIAIGAEARLFRHITVISDGLRARLRLRRDRTHILPLGADPMTIAPKTFDSLHLLYVGNLSARRRIDETLIGFARYLAETGSSARYTIVGDGPPGERDRLLALVRGLGLGHAVELPGFVAHDRLCEYFERCNVGVSFVPITPYYTHQPPTKTFEYLLAGIPVLATATAENQKVVTGTNGILIHDSAADFCRGLKDLAATVSRYSSEAIRMSAAAHGWNEIMNQNALPYLGRIAAGSFHRDAASLD